MADESKVKRPNVLITSAEKGPRPDQEFNFVEPWLLDNDFEFPEGNYDIIRIFPPEKEFDGNSEDDLDGVLMIDSEVIQKPTNILVHRENDSNQINNRLRYVCKPKTGSFRLRYRLSITTSENDNNNNDDDDVDNYPARKRAKKTTSKKPLKREPRLVGDEQTVLVGYSSTNPLNDYQQDIVAEALTKKSGGISVPMGNGKTLTYLVLGQMQSPTKPFLVICSKTLSVSWEIEIDKFFQNRLPYTVFQGDKGKRERWVLDPQIRLVIVTPDMLAQAYKEHQIQPKFSWAEEMFGAITNRHYRNPVRPWLTNHKRGSGIFYAIEWGSIAVDEAQDHTNINTNKCRAIGALCSLHRWLLSGTMFNEPKVERILGFAIMLNLDRPRSLPGTMDLVRSRVWGIRQFMIERGHNPTIKMPKYKEKVVAHNLYPEEAIIYESLRVVMREIKNHADRLRRDGDVSNARRFSQYILALVTYLRQALICPIVPIASVCVDMADYKGKSHLSRVMVHELNARNLDTWLDDEASVRSSRISAIVTELEQHYDDHVVIFGAFKSCMNVLLQYVDAKKFNIFIMSSTMSRNQRMALLENFKRAKSGLLFMTYGIGAVGLNLQCANTVMIMDMQWNYGQTSQAIARVFRAWQINDVEVVFFTSNTGIERAILEKQLSKLKVITELYQGNIQTKVPKLKMDEVLKIIEKDDNSAMVDSVRKFKASDHMGKDMQDMIANKSAAQIEADEQKAKESQEEKHRALGAVRAGSMGFGRQRFGKGMTDITDVVDLSSDDERE